MEFNTTRPGTRDEDAGRETFGADREVAPVTRWREVSARGARAPAVALRDLVEADALLASAVEIIVAGQACGFPRLDEHRGERIAELEILHRERSAVSVVAVLSAPVVILAPEKERQHGRVAPCRRGDGGPLVVITAMTTRVAHGVDRAAAAQHLAALPVEPPAGERRLTLRAIAPVDAAVARQKCDARRHVDHRMAVRAASLDEQHTQLLSRRQ